eukprot:CAMPEP_0115193104 /NCGR_PEP_ID=MMETSP0270-20121206/13383_1 /TAXON_ID=71861 /ORGANISM="Scrippsiella trochoidea, Strain CCMP3099" /LENGTH=114 /DNA_ID=CAMNT_0002606365 /DNA_START=141 /DNA_END=481 /DNA_ORIENTATION=-
MAIHRVDNTRIVTVMKLGFVVKTLFHFKRIDRGLPKLTLEEFYMSMMLTAHLLTSFLFLTASMCFSMEGMIMAQALMVKVLLRVTRIPIPTARDIYECVTKAADFEVDLPSAFR